MPHYLGRSLSVTLCTIDIDETTTKNPINKVGPEATAKVRHNTEKFRNGVKNNTLYERPLTDENGTLQKLEYVGEDLGVYGCQQTDPCVHEHPLSKESSLSTATRALKSKTYKPEGLCLAVKLSNDCFASLPSNIDAEIRENNRLDIKIDVFFNGEFEDSEIISSRHVRVVTDHTRTVFFHGRRAERLCEAPWIIIPPRKNVDIPTRNVSNGDANIQHRWKAINRKLHCHSVYLDKENKQKSVLAQYLQQVASMPCPDKLQGSAELKFGILDVVISIGSGKKDASDTKYCVKPVPIRLSPLPYNFKKTIMSRPKKRKHREIDHANGQTGHETGGLLFSDLVEPVRQTYLGITKETIPEISNVSVESHSAVVRHQDDSRERAISLKGVVEIQKNPLPPTPPILPSDLPKLLQSPSADPSGCLLTPPISQSENSNGVESLAVIAHDTSQISRTDLQRSRSNAKDLETMREKLANERENTTNEQSTTDLRAKMRDGSSRIHLRARSESLRGAPSQDICEDRTLPSVDRAVKRPRLRLIFKSRSTRSNGARDRAGQLSPDPSAAGCSEENRQFPVLTGRAEHRPIETPLVENDKRHGEAEIDVELDDLNEDCIITYANGIYRQIPAERCGQFEDFGILMGVRYILE